jgi:antitoxin component HigA of HigAB toxin-antitoxin module
MKFFKNAEEREEGGVIDEIIEEIKTPAEAIRFSVRRSGLTDKHIYLELGIEQSYWSRIMNGVCQFPMEKLKQFTEICGNDIFLRWLAKDCGYTLRPINHEEELEKALARVEKIKQRIRENSAN